MDAQSFIAFHKLGPDTIDGPACFHLLQSQMEMGLRGEGNIPMIPSYLPLDIQPAVGAPCCVLDAGGTNLRVAKAVFQNERQCELSGFYKTAMPGTEGKLSFDEFYGTLADYVRSSGCAERVGFCFSYTVTHGRDLDGILQSWSKEVRVPDAPGKPVGASLQKAVGTECKSVRVLNDSVAALLGAHVCDSEITLGLILGTGINICYPEPCANIPKVPKDLRKDTMIISTEIGEFDGFPKNTFEEAVIAASDEPALAHAEKQCAGAYLGEVISRAWQAAVEAGLLEREFMNPVSLLQVSDYLAGRPGSLPQNPAAEEIARAMIHRAAKIAAVLTAGTILRSCPEGKTCKMVIEGSQFMKLTGFAVCFRAELDALLKPYEIGYSVAEVDNSCLIGAALAAFAEPM